MRLRTLVAIPLLLLAFTVSTSSAHAATDREVIRVYHQAVQPIATSGSGVGTVRTFFIPMAVDGKSADNYYLTGTLTTLTTGMADGSELRASNLIYVFGDEADQLVVGGISLYPPSGATLPPGAKTVRPVVGGSGRFNGATGQVISRNYGADGWTHTFQIVLPD
jgi:hypothetical protein